MSTLPLNPSESTKKLNPHLYQSTIKGGRPLLPPPPKRIRQSTKSLMNKLEQEWFESLKHRFHIVAPQSLRFMLGNGVWYKPDFICWPVGLDSQDTRMRAFECKGPHAFRGGFENLKVAATKYPQIIWTLVWKSNGQWQEQRIWP